MRKQKCQEFCPQGQLWPFVPCPVAAFLEHSHPWTSHQGPLPYPHAAATPHKQCVLRDQGLGPFPMGALVTLGRVCKVAPMPPTAGAQVLAPDPTVHQGGPAVHRLQSRGSRPVNPCFTAGNSMFKRLSPVQGWGEGGREKGSPSQ